MGEKDNKCVITFLCSSEKQCLYYIQDKNKSCKYNKQGECISAVAAANAMVLNLKDIGVNITKTKK